MEAAIGKEGGVSAGAIPVGMIGVVERDERRPLPEGGHDRSKQREIGERVARSLQEEHRHIHALDCVAKPSRGKSIGRGYKR